MVHARGRRPAFRNLVGFYFHGVTITVKISITLLFWNSNRKNDDDYMGPKVSHGTNWEKSKFHAATIIPGKHLVSLEMYLMNMRRELERLSETWCFECPRGFFWQLGFFRCMCFSMSSSSGKIARLSSRRALVHMSCGCCLPAHLSRCLDNTGALASASASCQCLLPEIFWIDSAPETEKSWDWVR